MSTVGMKRQALGGQTMQDKESRAQKRLEVYDLEARLRGNVQIQAYLNGEIPIILFVL